jgi:hypothetical protein
MTISEPQIVYPEAEFHKAIVGLIKAILTERNLKFVLLERFGLDVAVSSKSRMWQRQFVFWK